MTLVELFRQHDRGALTTRTLNVLDRLGVETGADVAQLTEREIRLVHGSGQKVLDEVKRVLAIEGFALAGDNDEIIALRLPPKAVEHIDDLVDTGLYGLDRADVCERLVCAQLLEIIEKGGAA